MLITMTFHNFYTYLYTPYFHLNLEVGFIVDQEVHILYLWYTVKKIFRASL